MMRDILFTLTLILAVFGAAPALAGDATYLHAIDAKTPEGLQALLGYSEEPLPLMSAHRGGALPGYPENCLVTFENTIRHAYSMLEIDLRYTKDGVVVLNHDETLDRTTTGKGKVADHTLAELKKLRQKDLLGEATDYQIPTLDEALEWARGKTILVLDMKDVPVAAGVKKVEEHHAEAFAMLMVYNFESVKKCYELNPKIMMEVMVGDRERFAGYDATGVPWTNAIVFVSHTPPEDLGLLEMIHAKGASCMAGTSRNLDHELWAKRDGDTSVLAPSYRALLGKGIDVIETNLPIQLGQVLYADPVIPASKAQYFLRR